ncbi:MAG: GxGYxYP domain-containing protein [Sedimentisphaeraceae bacterium JB056]
MLKRHVFFIVLLFVIFAGITNGSERILSENINAWGSSVWGKSYASKTIDSSGLASDIHDEDYNHMWLTESSDSGSRCHANQDTSLGSAWIWYKFDKVYEVQSLKIWNYNQTNYKDRGLRNVTIEYSLDGYSWFKLGDYEISQAGSQGTYSQIINLGVDAKNIVITAHEQDGNWGGDSYGLSEVQFYADISRKTSPVFPQTNADQLVVSTDTLLHWSAGKDSVAYNVYLSDQIDSLEMPADFNLDSYVDFKDIPILGSNWLSVSDNDLNTDGKVDLLDFALFGKDFNKQNAALKSHQTELVYNSAGLTKGEDYYWRVDSVDNEGAVEKGYIWNFTVNSDPAEAYSSIPADAEEGVDESDVTLSWNAGEGAQSHEIYFGEDYNQVAYADVVSSVFQGSQIDTSLNLGSLEADKVYYWRVDEVADNVRVKGQIWSFTTSTASLDFGIGYPEHLYVARARELSQVEQITLQSLQGIIAQSKPEIFIETPNNRMWLEDMVDNYGISYERQEYLRWYLEHFENRLTGYILFDFDDKASIRVAASLAGITNAVAVDSSIQRWVGMITGLTLVEDVRGKDEQWLYYNHWDSLRHDLIVGNNDVYMQDISPAFKAFNNYSSDSGFVDQLYNSMGTLSAQYFGWIDPALGSNDESEQVTYHSEYGLDTNGAGLNYNFSTYAGFSAREPKIKLRQPASDNTYVPEENVHYVCFYMSDMGNLAFLPSAKGWANNVNHFGHPRRGEFGMGWGTSQMAAKLMPSVLNWWYRNATDNDSFVASTYVFPTDHPDLDEYTKLLDSRMKQSDTDILWIYDDLRDESWDFESPEYEPYLQKFADMDSLRGGIYAEYYPYYAYDGRIKWVEGKPFVNIKYVLDENNDTGLSLAGKINKLPADVYNQASYSLVLVNAWAFDGELMPQVCDAVDGFDSDVRVVTPHEFFERLYMNFPINVEAIASSESEFTAPAVNCVNTSGMTGQAHNNSYHDMWLSYRNDPTGWIKFNLNSTFNLSRMKVWNYNQDIWTCRGIKDADIYWSNSSSDPDGGSDFNAANWNYLSTERFNQAPGTNDYNTPDTVELNLEARWIAIDIKSNFGNSGFDDTGLSEVRFFVD